MSSALAAPPPAAGLPHIPGMEVAARYRPFGCSDVGGDFYDVFPAPGGWAFAVGDVAGKGAPAAAAAGHLAGMLRHWAQREPAPAAVLRRLDETVRRDLGGDLLATAICGTLRTTCGPAVEVTIAGAGHPPALVRRCGGRVEPVVRSGRILGAGPAPAPPETTLTLAAGDVLVVYTDGVTEARDGTGWVGEEGIAAAVGAAPSDAALLADAVERRALDGHRGPPRDDIAVLALGVPR